MASDPLNQRDNMAGRKKRLVIGFGALLIMAILFGAVAVNAQRSAEARRGAQSWYIHTFQVLLTTEALKAAVNMSIRGERGFIITGDRKFLRPYAEGRRDAAALMARLETLTRDNAAQQANLAALRTRRAAYYAVLERAIARTRAGDHDGAAAIVRSGEGMRRIEAVLAAIQAIEVREEQLLTQRQAAIARVDATIDTHYLTLAGIGLALLLVAGAVGVSAANAQKRVRDVAEQLRLSATTDELTGLANRRCFMHALDIEVARARRSGTPLSVAVADIDHFKQVNDRYGHGGGDEVLRALSRIFESIMRTGDMVGRLGGEEFAILMPDTDEIQARIACERLRGAIAGRRIRLATGEEIAITLSTGIALLVPGEDRDRLVTRADAALYRAKAGGRNQVRLAA